MIENPQLKPYKFKSQTLKHVGIIKVSDKPTNDTLWKGLELEIAEFEYKHDRKPSAETIQTPISNP